VVTEPDATNVLRSMASKYASLNSYADTGYVTSTFKSGLVHRRTHTIGRLLLPETEGVAVFDLIDPQLREETGIDGVEYYSIAARHPKGDDRELWIEKDTLLLRRVICSRETARAEEVREGIRVNVPLEQALFAA